eukprot:scaffold70277_cov20-Tisochrysis_lutea.AAC.2
MKTKFTSCLAPRLCLLSRNRVCCFSAAAAVAHAQKRGQHVSWCSLVAVLSGANELFSMELECPFHSEAR